MKKSTMMAVFAAGVGAMLNFAGCGGESPENVTLDFLRHVKEGSATPAYLQGITDPRDKDAAGWLALLATELHAPFENATFKIVNTEKKDDIATVTVRISEVKGRADSDNKFMFQLVDGKWKVKDVPFK